MFHEASIQRAVDYIEANLNGEISLYDAARAAGYSVPHFYRVFKALTGDTVGAYALKRRLSLAAVELCSGGKTVTEIAYGHGFASHDGFTRAFHRVFGVTPALFRKQGRAEAFAPFVATGQPYSGDDEGIQFELTDRPEITVAGMRCSAMEWDEDGAVGRLWGAFLQRVEEIGGLAAPTAMYGICETGHTEPGRFPYMAAIVVRAGCAPPAGMSVRMIRAQRFLLANVPEWMSVPDAYKQTIGHATANGYLIDDYDYIELYEELFQDPADHRFMLLIPIKSLLDKSQEACRNENGYTGLLQRTGCDYGAR